MVDSTELPWPGYSFAVTSASSEAEVARSYEVLAQSLGVPRTAIITVTQVHGSDSVVVEHDRPDTHVQADALLTNSPNWILGVKLADCCGVLLHDPVHHAIAAIHSGWRGTAQNIVAKVLTKMQAVYGTQPADLMAWLSPCASGSRYHVREDVVAVLGEFCTPTDDQTSLWTFDNHQAITTQLVRAGVPSASIQRDPACTMVDTRWHSHRRDGAKAGRMLAFIGLLPMAGK